VTRLSIDHLKSARVRREQYVGQWLPEPVVTDSAPDAAAQAETADSLSMAFLVLLESLSPVERAVFLLREVFDYDYAEIPGGLEAVEVIAERAVAAHRAGVRCRGCKGLKPPSSPPSSPPGRTDRRASRQPRNRRHPERYGGGKAPAWQPIYGREQVAKLLAGTLTQVEPVGASVVPTELNGQPGVMFVDEEGRIAAVMSLEIADGVVQTIRGITNPDKLAHLGPVADLRAILRRRRMMAERDD
jgi:RNA polymerase sigma-70 factor, ECF subfamily